ncbi:hypothetical protein FRC11_013579 [Ceratobasidium sp. 423]|nr:hypothetical protein FRC11_013579 [Ceratobasidium sp. 423]
MPTVQFSVTLKDLSKMIDVSLLHPTMTDAEILAGLEAAKTCDATTACVKPYSVPVALEALKGTDVLVCPVIGFPAGNSSVAVKVFEATEVVKLGAQEVDMACSPSPAYMRERVLTERYVTDGVKQINHAVVIGGAILKVVFETDFLQDSHITHLCQICSDLGVAFAKTSTGYGFNKQSNGMYSYASATDHNLKLMRKHSSEKVKVKAAGGVRMLDDLLHVRALGTTRVRATTTREMLQEAAGRRIGKEPKEVEVVIPE